MELIGHVSLLDSKPVEAAGGWRNVVLDIETAAIATLGSQHYPVGVIQRGLVFDEVSQTA